MKSIISRLVILFIFKLNLLTITLGKVVDITNCDTIEECYDIRLHPAFSPLDDNYSDLKNSLFKFRFHGNNIEKFNSFWIENAQQFLNKQLEKKKIEKPAKNVIFFIGDGMSLTTIAGARMLLGGEEKQLFFERFPYTGLVKTYCLDKIVPDSASTATSYLRGVKVNYGTIGVDGHVKRKDCYGMSNENYYVDSIAKWALDAGKEAGLVTTTRVTHASPAGIYAYTADRDWENDSELKKVCNNIPGVSDIAYQLVHGKVGKKLKVILGGGRREFREIDIETNTKGKRSDKQDLIQQWLDKAKSGENRTYIYNRSQLMNIYATKTDKLLGLFDVSHMRYHLETKENKNLGSEQPTLPEMTQKAIELLSENNKNGYFLFVEGGKIDLAHHETYAKIAFDETTEFAKAVKIARDITDIEDTLIVVSSDHSHTMSLSGYPRRHGNILDVAQMSKADKLPYLTANYANGKAFREYFDEKTNKRKDPSKVDREKTKATYPSTVYLKTETHGGEDVGVFASGPYAHFFTGAYEQNFLPHLMAYASCIARTEPTACSINKE